MNEIFKSRVDALRALIQRCQQGFGPVACCSAGMGCRAVWLLIAVLFAQEASAADIRPIAPRVVGAEFTDMVRKGDSLTAISARFAISEKTLARDNGLKPPYLLKPGNRLKVNNSHLSPKGLAMAY